MGRVTASLLALLLGAVATVALSSCGGGGDAKLLPGSTASEITTNLDRIKQMVSGGDCVGAEDATQLVATQIDELGGVDKKLKQALREGTDRLESEVASECVEETVEAVEPSEPVIESTTTKPSKKEKKPKKPKTTPATPAAPTTPTQTTPATPETPPATPAEPPTEGGGTEPPSGGVGTGSPTGEGG